MTGRRGFLGGCLAVLASPMALFSDRSHWRNYTFEYSDVTKQALRDQLSRIPFSTVYIFHSDKSLKAIVVKIFAHGRIEVSSNGEEWHLDGEDCRGWMIYRLDSRGGIRFRVCGPHQIDVDWYFISDTPVEDGNRGHSRPGIEGDA